MRGASKQFVLERERIVAFISGVGHGLVGPLSFCGAPRSLQPTKTAAPVFDAATCSNASD